MSSNGMVVVGLVTGDHKIEDINVVVPHMVATPITPDQMCNSRDLNIALQQKKIFRLDMTPFKPNSAPDVRAQELEQENQRLKEAGLNMMEDWKKDVSEFVHRFKDRLIKEWQK